MTTQFSTGRPETGDTLRIAEYVCGLLTHEERASVHELLARDDTALAQALAWEERLLALVDALPRVQPAPALRERLQKTLGIKPPPALQPPPQPILLQRESVDGPFGILTETSALSAAPKTAAPRPASHTEPRRSWLTHTGRSARQATAGPVSSDKLTGRRPAPPTPPAPKEPGPEEPASKGLAVEAPARKRKPVDPETASRTGGEEDAVAAGGMDPAARKVLIRKLWFWRLIGLCATATALAGFLMPGEPAPPPVQVIKVAPTRAAILQAPGTSSTPGWTATLDPDGNLMMRPLVRTELSAGTQALLWTRSARVPEPRLLGRIDPNKPVQIAASRLGTLADDQILEITQETEEDAAKGVPNGPILFIGQMTVFGPETPAQASQ